MAQSDASPLVTCEWLHEKTSQGDFGNIVILDVSWSSQNNCQDEFNKSHIPGARYLDVLVGPHTELHSRNLPPAETLQEAARAAGVNEDSHVILYSDTHNAGFFLSGRAWWTLTVHGAKDVSILNGGLKRWVSLDYDTTSDPTDVKRGNFTAKFDSTHRLSFEEMNKRVSAGNATILDSRPQQSFEAGHLPTAKNLPYTQLVDSSTQQMVSPDAVKDALKQAGVDTAKPLTTYCNTGMSSCTLAFAYKLCGGSDFAVFHGGFTEWKNKAESNIEKS